MANHYEHGHVAILTKRKVRRYFSEEHDHGTEQWRRFVFCASAQWQTPLINGRRLLVEEPESYGIASSCSRMQY